MRDLRTGAKGGRARGEFASEGGEEELKERQQLLKDPHFQPCPLRRPLPQCPPTPCAKPLRK